MANDLEYIMSPDEAEARARREARRLALRRRRPKDLALALTPEPSLAATGRAQLAGAARELGDIEDQGSRAQEFSARRQAEARDYALRLQDLALRRQAMKNYQSYTSLGGEPMAFDPRTGQYRRPFAPLPQMGSAHGGPAPSASLPRPAGKTTEAQMKMIGNIGSAAQAMHMALRVGFPTPGLRGLPQSIGQQAARRGYPALASPEAQQTYSAWYNVISPIVHARTGQQMSVQELEREFAGLLPRPGEDERTQLMKVNLIVPMLREYTRGLPPEEYQRLNADLDEAEAIVPRTVEALRAMRATGSGGFQPMPSHQSKSGRTIYQR